MLGVKLLLTSSVSMGSANTRPQFLHSTKSEISAGTHGCKVFVLFINTGKRPTAKSQTLTGFAGINHMIFAMGICWSTAQVLKHPSATDTLANFPPGCLVACFAFFKHKQMIYAGCESGSGETTNWLDKMKNFFFTRYREGLSLTG